MSSHKTLFPYIQGSPQKQEYPRDLTEEQLFQLIMDERAMANEINPMSGLRKDLSDLDEFLAAKEDKEGRPASALDYLKTILYSGTGAAAGAAGGGVRGMGVSSLPFAAMGAYGGAQADRPSRVLSAFLQNYLPDKIGGKALQTAIQQPATRRESLRQMLSGAVRGALGGAAGYEAGTVAEKFFNPNADPTYQSGQENLGAGMSAALGALGGTGRVTSPWGRASRIREKDLKESVETLPKDMAGVKERLAELGVDTAALKTRLVDEKSALKEAENRLTSENRLFKTELQKKRGLERLSVDEKIAEIRGKEPSVKTTPGQLPSREAEEKLLSAMRKEAENRVEKLRLGKKSSVLKEKEELGLLASTEAVKKELEPFRQKLAQTSQQIAQNGFLQAKEKQLLSQYASELEKNKGILEKEYGSNVPLLVAALGKYVAPSTLMYGATHYLAPSALSGVIPYVSLLATVSMAKAAADPKVMKLLRNKIPPGLFDDTVKAAQLVREDVQRGLVPKQFRGTFSEPPEEEKRTTVDTVREVPY